MDNEQFTIQVDLQSFKTCQFCLRTLPILAIEGLFFFMFTKELIKTKRNYDRPDTIIFILSTMVTGVDLVSILVLSEAISVWSHGLRLIWTITLYFIFLRFVFQNKESSQIFIVTFLLLILSFIVSIVYRRKIYIRYPLLIMYVVIGLCCLHQILFIRQILRNEKERKKSINRFLNRSNNKSKKQMEVELIDPNQIVEYKVLSSQYKYHIKLRKSFCQAFMIGLGVNYFFLVDLRQSQQSIGQFFLVLIVELLLPGIYYFYTTINQWINEKAKASKQSRKDEQKQSLITQN